MSKTADNIGVVVLELPNESGTLALTSDLENKADLVDGKVPLSQINDALIGAVNYQGNYNASNNTPALPTAVGNKGKYYVVTVAGTQQGLTFTNGDWIISNGTIWEKVDSNNDVTSVAGKTGAVILGTTDIGGLETALNLKANDADVVHKTGNVAESISGTKSFTDDLYLFKALAFRDLDGNTSLFTPSSQINAGSSKDSNLYIYGNNPFSVWTNGVKRFSVNGDGSANFSGTVSVSNATDPNHAVALGQVQTEIAIVSDLTVALVVPNLYKYYALTGLSATASLPPIAGNVGKTLIVTNKTDAAQFIFSNDSVANDIFSSAGAVNTYTFKGSVTLFNDGVHWVITN